MAGQDEDRGPSAPDHDPTDSDDRAVPLDDPALPAAPLADEDEAPVGDAVSGGEGDLPQGAG